MTRPGHSARRSLGSRVTLSIAAALLSAVACCIVSAPQASAAGVPVGQALVVLLRDHVALSAPSTAAHRLATIASRRPLTGVRTVLPVVGQATSKQGWA